MLALLQLDRGLSMPLQKQIYGQLQELIVSGRVKAGTRMCATRLLADQLDVSRTTVLLAYERLIAEGYLHTRPAMGTFVSVDLADRHVATLPECAARSSLAARQPPTSEANLPDLWIGCPDPQLFPLKVWRRLLLATLEKQAGGDGAYPAAGLECLRQAIAGWLAYNRGIFVSPAEVIVVAGVHQAYDIAARLCIRRNDRVVVESPGYHPVSSLFEAMGARLVPVPVDEQGIDTDRLPSDRVALAHVMPSHQYPTGGTLPLDRRRRLIEWAQRSGAYVIEDDYDGEFRYHGSSPTALKNLDPAGRVIHVGCFSKSLGPRLRLAYMVMPPELIARAFQVPTLRDNSNSRVDQAVLARFIEDGFYAHHLRCIRKVYMARRDSLIEALNLNFAGIRLAGVDAGTHLTWRLPSDFPSARVVAKMASGCGIAAHVAPRMGGSDKSALGYFDQSLLLGYSLLSKQQIHHDIAKLAAALVGRRAPKGTHDGVGALAMTGTAADRP